MLRLLAILSLVAVANAPGSPIEWGPDCVQAGVQMSVDVSSQAADNAAVKRARSAQSCVDPPPQMA
jgi:hypothetical protein